MDYTELIIAEINKCQTDKEKEILYQFIKGMIEDWNNSRSG